MHVFLDCYIYLLHLLVISTRIAYINNAVKIQSQFKALLSSNDFCNILITCMQKIQRVAHMQIPHIYLLQPKLDTFLKLDSYSIHHPQIYITYTAMFCNKCNNTICPKKVQIMSFPGGNYINLQEACKEQLLPYSTPQGRLAMDVVIDEGQTLLRYKTHVSQGMFTSSNMVYINPTSETLQLQRFTLPELLALEAVYSLLQHTTTIQHVKELGSTYIIGVCYYIWS